MAQRDDLLRAVQAARTGDQLSVAVAALDAHDRRRTASLQESRATDLSATAVRQTLEPLPAFERHTAATDWLGDEQIPTDYRTAMIAEASRWYRGVPREVAADQEEFAEQALGHAYTAASPYGEHALAARREFMTYVGYLARQGASGLPQIEQERDPQDNPAPTPLPQDVFDNFAPPQNAYNGGVESPNRQSQISSEQASQIQQDEQMNSSGSGFGSGPERPDEHSESMDTADSYAEIPLGPPGQIPTTPPGASPSASSTPTPGQDQDMDAGADRRQASLRVSAYTGPDQHGFRWHIGADEDVDTFDTPYHERCGSLHWPEQACSNGHAHTASVAVGYVMNAEDFARRAHFEAMGSAEGSAVLRTAGGDLRRLAGHHDTLVGSFKMAARTEDEIAWLHGYLARVRPVLAGGRKPREGDEDSEKDAFGQAKKKKGKGKKGKDQFGGKQAPPFGSKAGSRPGLMPDFPLAAEAALIREAPGKGEHAPYKIVHDSDGWHVENELGERKNKKGYSSKGKARKLQKALYVNVPGASESAGKAASRRTAAGGYGESDEDYWEPQVRPHMRDAFRELQQQDPEGGEREPTDADRARFEQHVRRNYPADVADAYFHQHEGASQLPQIQQVTDPAGNPDPGGDRLNPEVMWPLNPASGGADGDADADDQSKAKEAARRSMTPSTRAVQMFGRMDAMEGKRPHHKDNYAFSRNAHGQYLRGWNETRGSMDAMLDREPIGKDQYAEMTGRPDLHKHYLGVHSEVKARRSQEGPPEVTASLRRTADTLTRPHQTTDDATPPFNSDSTSPSPWSSNEEGGDYGQGVKDGQDDAAAGEHPTFSDNSSTISPYVKGYSIGYSGRPPDPGQMDVPRSIGGDSGQAQNSEQAQRAFQVSHASLQRTAGCIGCPHPSHLGEPCPAEGCRHLHSKGEEGGGPGQHARTIGHEPDPDNPGYSRPRGSGKQSSVRRQAHDFTESEREHAEHSLGPDDKLPVNSRQDLENAHRRGHQVTGIPQSEVDAYLSRLDKEYGYSGSEEHAHAKRGLRQVSAAFITREAVREPGFRKGYKYAARWQPGMRMVSRGTPAFEAGLYAAIADRPGIQEAWVQAHTAKAGRYPQLGDRIEAHASFSRKLMQASAPGEFRVSATGCYPVRGLLPKAAATSVDLITDGPGASPDPMGNTPLNGPGTPPPMGGGEDPAKSGGPSPYQGAPPQGAGPVAPDDVLGQPQEPPQASGSMTQTYSGRHPENVSLAPAAPNTADGAGYRNTDAYSGDPQHKPQALAFRRKVQAGLAARRVPA